MYSILTKLFALSLVSIGLHPYLAVGAKLPSSKEGHWRSMRRGGSQVNDVAAKRTNIVLPIERRLDGRLPASSTYSIRSSLASHSMSSTGTYPSIADGIPAPEGINGLDGPTLSVNVAFGGEMENVTYSMILEQMDGLISVISGGNNSQLASSSINTGLTVNYTTVQGNFALADVYNDSISIGNFTVAKAPFVLYENIPYAFLINGTVGLAPSTANAGTIMDPKTNKTVVPLSFVEQLYANGQIKNNLYTISLSPSSNDSAVGELTIGDIDSSKYTGELSYFNKSNASTVASFWGIDAKIGYGAQNTTNITNISNGTRSGVFDIGTSSLKLNQYIYINYMEATGATYDNNTGLLLLPADKVNDLQSLYFTFENKTLELIPNAQILPKSTNIAFGGVENATYLLVEPLEYPAGSGPDFVLGYSFMQRFYSVFNEEYRQIGLAETNETYTVV